MDIGLEIILNSGNTIYFAFEKQDRMEEFYIVFICKVTIEAETSFEKTKYLWQSGQISNFEYLMRLNQAGNRSTNDLSQYPVFPLNEKRLEEFWRYTLFYTWQQNWLFDKIKTIINVEITIWQI